MTWTSARPATSRTSPPSSPEGQAVIAAALDRAQNGTAHAVPHAEIEAIVERQRLAALKVG